MSILEQFAKDDLDFLVALPYRTGLWVSVSDSAGGNEADEAEIQVLESIIHGFATDYCKSEVTESLMKQTVSCRSQWSGWAENIENVPSECRQAVELLSRYVDHKNVTAFKENLMEIAFAVAMAYREFDDNVSLVEKVTMYGHFISDRLKALIQNRAPKTHDEIFNISRAERLALTELSEALRRDEKEGMAVVDVYAEENIDPSILEKIARSKEESKGQDSMNTEDDDVTENVEALKKMQAGQEGQTKAKEE